MFNSKKLTYGTPFYPRYLYQNANKFSTLKDSNTPDLTDYYNDWDNSDEIYECGVNSSYNSPSNYHYNAYSYNHNYNYNRRFKGNRYQKGRRNRYRKRNNAVFIEKEFEDKLTISNEEPFVKEELLKVKLLVQGGSKELMLFKGDDHRVVINDFCFVNRVSSELVKPIIAKVQEALRLIDEIFSADLTENDIQCLKLLQAIPLSQNLTTSS